MKKLIIAFIAVLSLMAASAHAEGRYEFENSLDPATGSAISTVTNTLGPGGSAVYTDTDEGRAILIDGYGLDLGKVGSSFTVSARVKVGSNGNTKTLFFKNMGDQADQRWTGVIFRGGVPTVWTHDGSAYRWSSIASKAGNYLDNWVDIKYVENNGEAKLYVDGEMVSTGSVLSGEGELYLGTTYWADDAIAASVKRVSVVNSAFEDFDFGAEYLIADIDLYAAGSDIEWVSEDESVLSNSGAVTRGEEDRTVTIAGTQKTVLGDIKKEYTFTVLKKPEKVNDSVILSYDLEDNGGGIVRDISGNGNHGVSFGNMTGAHFDGADDYITMPDGLLNDLDEFTIVMRLKPESAKTKSTVFSFGNDTGNFFLNASTPGANELYLALAQEMGATEAFVASVPGIRSGEETAIAVTVKGSEAAIYQNGVLVADGDLAVSPSALGGASNYLAKSPEGACFAGDIYEFTIYPYALNSEEVAAIHYIEADGDSYIKDIGLEGLGLIINLNRFCMVAASFFDASGREVSSTTIKASSDDLTAVFALPDGAVSVKIAAYDADRGIVRDIRAAAVYKGVIAYTKGEALNIINTNEADVSAVVTAASYDDEGRLKEVNVKPLDIPAKSDAVILNTDSGDRLLIWY